MCVCACVRGRSVIHHATTVFETANAATVGTAEDAVQLEDAVRQSVAGTLLLELLTGLALFWRRRFVADSLLPALVKVRGVVGVGGGGFVVARLSKAVRGGLVLFGSPVCSAWLYHGPY